MNDNRILLVLLAALLGLALFTVMACGDDDDDDDDDDNDDNDTADGDDDTGGDEYTAQCEDWFETCTGTTMGAGFFCDALTQYTGNSCYNNAVGDYLDCLLAADCDFETGGAVEACANDFLAALEDC